MAKLPDRRVGKQALNVLVTGGAGYLGSTLVGILLDKGHRVRVFDSLLYGGQSLLGFWHLPSFDFVRGDLRDRSLVRAALDGIEAVIHLAAIVGDPACARHPDLAREVNLNASLSLLEDCRHSRVRRFLFASTCSNYGRMRDPDAYVDETSELTPLSLYAETKVQFEKTLLASNKSDPLCITSLRLATLYGVSLRMRFDLTVNEFTLDILTKNRLVVFGEQFWRPYIHVRDAALGFSRVLSASEGVQGQVFNLGATSQNFRKRDLVEILRVHAPEACIEYVIQKGDSRDYRVSFEKIARQLAFSPSRTVDDGIDEVARLLRSNLIARLDDPSLRN